MTPSIRAAGSDRLSDSASRLPTACSGLWALYLLLAPTTGFSWIESWHNEQRAVQIVLLSLTALAVAGLTAFGPDADSHTIAATLVVVGLHHDRRRIRAGVDRCRLRPLPRSRFSFC